MASLLWQTEMRESIRTPEALVQRGVICEADLPAIRKIHQSFAYSVTPYYARLINWLDPNDPLLRMVVPSLNELDTSGSLDVGGEAENTHDEGLQVKYPSTALLLPIPACFSYCRFCFRKRLFNPKVRGDEILKNLDNALDFVRAHPSIDNILLTGGDPLLVNTSHLTKFLGEIRKIKSIKVIRFGTRGLVFLPSRITSDPELVDLLRKTSTPERRVYLVNHFNHPRELTADVSEAADILTKAGVILVNQAVLLRGVNDSPFVLRELFNELAARGITPYYTFHCKFIQGSGHFRIPLHEAWDIFNEATRGLNGLAKRSKFIMTHFSGKIEILGTENEPSGRRIYLKYHQARDESQIGKLLSFPLPDDAFWLDDLPGVDVDPRLRT